jgi:hypothetical protein
VRAVGCYIADAGRFVHQRVAPISSFIGNTFTRPQRLTTALRFLAIAAFLLMLARTTDWMYLKTEDHRVLDPKNIIAGASQAPNQYRVLSPILSEILDRLILHNARRSDHAVIFLSILLAYAATMALFYKASGSVTVTLLALLALLGCFSFGMEFKYRQEFFEVAFVAGALLAVLLIRRLPALYAVLAVLTLFGSLNRETFAFCLSGVAVHVAWERIRKNAEAWRSHLAGFLSLCAVFALCYFGVRWHFGPSPYYCEFWQYTANINNALRIANPHNIFYIGAGLACAFVATLTLGNRAYLPFILGYAVPMFVATFLVSSFSEHRVFYPVMALLIASMVHFSSKEKSFEQRA